MNADPAPKKNHERVTGIRQVFPDPNDHEATNSKEIDIVAVHGLSAESSTTWEAWEIDGDPTSRRVVWLSDPSMLPKAMPKARIFTYDWNANYDTNASSDLFIGHANALLETLHAYRDGVSRHKTPIIFIASCFGGLLLVKAVNRAVERFHSTEKNFKMILRYTIGIIFLGTPFRGSWETGSKVVAMRIEAAQDSSSTEVVSYSKELTTCLKQSTRDKPSPLDEMVIRFNEILGWKDFRIPMVCFYETQHTRNSALLSRVPEGYNRGQVDEHGYGHAVERDSATLAGQVSISLDLRHAMMHKFYSPESRAFMTITSKLREFVAKANETLGYNDVLLATDLGICSSSSLTQTSKLAAAFDGMDRRFKELEQAFVTGTTWIRKTEQFTAWRSQTSSEAEIPLLVLEGKAGCGKSVLMQKIVADARSPHDLRKNGLCLAYFFHAANGTPLQNSPEGLYRSMLTQLLGQIIAESVPTQSQPLLSWRDKVLSVLPYAGEQDVTIFIDALDECMNQEEILDFLDILARTKVKLRICLSVRDRKLYGYNLAVTHTLQVEEHNGEDIASYVEKKLGLRSRPYLRQRLVRKVLERASHIFLWVNLVVRRINEIADLGWTDEKLEAEVDAQGSELHPLYKTFFQNINLPEKDASERMEALTLLRLVQVAIRPLTIAEVRSALEHDKKLENMPKEYASLSEDEYEKRVQYLCRGLLELEKVCIPTYKRPLMIGEKATDEDYRKETNVQLTHYSVREFLDTSDHSEELAHLHAAEICMQVIDSKASSATFWSYAMQFWTAHARKGNAAVGANFKPIKFVASCGYGTRRLIKEYRTCIDKRRLHNWQGNRRDITHTRMLRNKEESLLPILAFEGCTKLISIHAERCRQPEKCWKNAETLEAAFFLAAQRGWEDSVKQVLEVAQGNSVTIDIDKPFIRNQSPLVTACMAGRRQLISTLLEIGCKPLSSPFQIILRAGHLETIKMFLEHAKRNGTVDDLLAAKDLDGNTAFHFAAKEGNWSMFQTLARSATTEAKLKGLLNILSSSATTAYQDAVLHKESLGPCQEGNDYSHIIAEIEDIMDLE